MRSAAYGWHGVCVSSVVKTTHLQKRPPAGPSGSTPSPRPAIAAGGPAWVNDVHSRLTPTRVGTVLRPTGRADLVRLVRRSLSGTGGISVAGGRHAMGSQPFGTGSIHFDLTDVAAVGDLDSRSGIVEVEPGVMWPKLMRHLDERQPSAPAPWCIVQKQTGADDLTLGGALASNIHGRGLRFSPLVQDIESFTLLTASGDEIDCSRTVNPDWFRRTIGGYGLFGMVTSLRLRLMRRTTVRREVTETTVDRIPRLLESAMDGGCLYGDFQFSTAPETDGFLRAGVFSVYRPVGLHGNQRSHGAPGEFLTARRWAELITLAHLDKARAFRTYVDHYRTTDGQQYPSDRQQLSTYLPDYHQVLARARGAGVKQSLVITELYVPPERLVDFFDDVRADMRRHETDLIYGVVRWIEPDRETFLPWATGRRACLVFNLNVRHTREGRARAAADFRRLIDRALDRGGAYYLTYHRHATRRQVEAAYPRFAEMLRDKERRDPRNTWSSDWYRHYRRLFDTA